MESYVTLHAGTIAALWQLAGEGRQQEAAPQKVTDFTNSPPVAAYL